MGTSQKVQQRFVTQIGSMVLQLFWKLVLIGGLWWNHLPVFGFFQHGTIPVVGANRPEQNSILKEYRSKVRQEVGQEVGQEVKEVRQEVGLKVGKQVRQNVVQKSDMRSDRHSEKKPDNKLYRKSENKSDRKSENKSDRKSENKSDRKSYKSPTRSRTESRTKSWMGCQRSQTGRWTESRTKVEQHSDSESDRKCVWYLGLTRTHSDGVHVTLSLSLSATACTSCGLSEAECERLTTKLLSLGLEVSVIPSLMLSFLSDTLSRESPDAKHHHTQICCFLRRESGVDVSLCLCVLRDFGALSNLQGTQPPVPRSLTSVKSSFVLFMKVKSSSELEADI
ncbi:hypothetical protein F7725_023473 [Dissostichus mawsoni]|uniref:Uncharacterized protein n=1 Tax=Dissostichus mawsoni TaxID=36200 RepID=A0A7J5Z537_DISMA|nr:hypothetical protein F7725_023473 [Dissostichus mawsoni]